MLQSQAAQQSMLADAEPFRRCPRTCMPRSTHVRLPPAPPTRSAFYRLVEVAVDCNLVERSGKSDLACAVRLISSDEPVEALQLIHQQPARFASPLQAAQSQPGIHVTGLGLQPDCGPARDGVDRTRRDADGDFIQATHARVRHVQAEAPPLDRNLRGASMELGHGASTLRLRRSIGVAQVLVRRGVVVARRPVDLVATRQTETRRVDSELSPRKKPNRGDDSVRLAQEDG
jgi:hypothetical protein